MKVHCFGNVRCDRCLLILITAGCMLIQKQQCTLAAALDSEILKGTNSNNSFDKHAWPPMKNHDIWTDVSTYDSDENFNDRTWEAEASVFKTINQDEFEFVANSLDSAVDVKGTFAGFNNETDDRSSTLNKVDLAKRRGKVLHIFPVPVDGECLSDDGRRTGNCFNAYECRQKGGSAKGECAMGFGVCCIFMANCNETISNNITYLISPQFPSFMPNNFSSCSIKVKLMSEDISQLRIDFHHFSIGQPNRRTGVCDGDVFNISGGPGGTISLCGQNSGQHIYYDVGGRSLPRQTLYGSLRPPTLAQIYPNLNGSTTDQNIEIAMNFAQRFLPIRLWEIRIAQIPFSQRAPAGCLQYHTGPEGFIQTFNFADNGRHLANQHYRVCMRQEMEMCTIMYQPCDEQSFRIGPSRPLRMTFQQSTMGMADSTGTGAIDNVASMPLATNTGSRPTTVMAMPASGVAADDPNASPPTTASTSSTSLPTSTMMSTIRTTTGSSPSTTVATTSTTAAMASSTNAASTASMGPTTGAVPQRSSTTTTSTTTPATTSTTTANSPLSDDVEGSGDDDTPVTPGTPNVSRRPRPVSGGFDLLGFLRSAFDLGLQRRRSKHFPQQSEARIRQQRQIFSTCTDRITLPCIIEDFIGTGLGPLPGCEPVHCGTQFCASGVWPCRIESTVTPFFINIHFGDGVGKGSAEDNIGACLRYAQVQCL